MFEWIIEKWLDKVIKPLENLVEGINAAAGLYDLIENTLHIPYPYNHLAFIGFILIIAIVLIGIGIGIKALWNGD